MRYVALVAGLAISGGIVLSTSPLLAQQSPAEAPKPNPEVSPSEDEEDSSDTDESNSDDGDDGGDSSDESKANEDEASETSSGSGKATESDGLPKAPETPEDIGDRRARELEEFRGAYERYAREIKDYQKTIDSIVDAEYQKKRSELNEKYERRSARLESLERERRDKAIEKFKRFLEEHPDRPEYTPDAMFRLAELYFEQENDEFLQADERYRREMKRYEAGRRPSQPEAPRRDYSQTIETFSKLVRNWPDYRLLDGAYYLLAYCEQKTGNPRKARDLFAELIVKRPKSEFVPEAWIRIGEYHFDRSDDPEEIALAKNAYEQAMKYEQSKFYDKALYKLAWSYYRLDRFEDAIEHFKQLVAYSDRQQAKGEQGSVLRAEAVKYIAVSLAEEDWDLDRKVDDNFGLPRIKQYLSDGKSYEREIIAKLVGRRQGGNKQGYLLKNSHYDEAVKVLQYALEQYPKHPKNPTFHKQLILALTKADQVDQAFEERRKLLDLYGPDSEWYAYQKQQGNEEAIERGDDLVRENLILAAKWYQQQAQELKDKAKVKQSEQLLARSRKKYRRAAEAYERYLKRYPDDRDIYRWNFYYADTLYYSGQYRRAYEQYRVVRELDLDDNKFQPKAAYSAVKSLEFQIKELAKQGEMPSSVIPSSNREDARKTARKQKETPEKERAQQQTAGEESDGIQSEPIPSVVKDYITAMDRFVVLGLDYKEDQKIQPKFAFNAAKLYYDFKHFDTARKRFKWIVDEYPEREIGFLAGSLLLETYRREENYDMMAKWADRLSGILKGDQAKAVKEEVQQHRLGALFKSAETLFDEEKYEKAADKYLELVSQAPDYENAPLALNNAAVAYEEVKKYQSAMKIYERVYREYPDSPLSGYALYRVGVNSERFFEFDKALQSYQLFYDKYEPPTPEALQQMNFSVEQKRPKALLSSAVLSMNLQNYRDAAGYYRQFIETYPDHDKVEEAHWQIVESWRKADDPDKMVEEIRNYRDEYGGNPDRIGRVLEGMMRIAEWHEANERPDEAKSMYEDIIETFKESEAKPGSEPAYYVAEAQFELAERKYTTWQEVTIEGSLQQQKTRLDKKIKEQKKVASAFKKVWQYKNLEWTLAAGFRIGSLFQGFAEALYNVPIPFKPGSKQYRIYRKQLEDIAIPLENKAVKRYEQTIKKAREEKIVNQWTKKTLEQLNKFRPQQYPLYKEEREARETQIQTGRSLMASPPESQENSDSNETSDETSGGDNETNDSPGDSSSDEADGTSDSNASDSSSDSSASGDSSGGQASNSEVSDAQEGSSDYPARSAARSPQKKNPSETPSN